MSDTARFLREFARDPLHTAAVSPSSAALAAAMVAPLPVTGDPMVVELGPGTGAFTSAIQHRLGGRGRHVAVERHAGWAELLAHRHPDVDVVCADAGALAAVLAERNITRVDAVVSGLPWIAHSPDLHAAITGTLAADGAFTQFAYSWTRWAPPARRQLADLRARFADVTTSRIVWRNLPPAVVHLARRPHRRS
jgi:phosphatidylethanolamine/phosphatidyl-N-methylethanolamine N-methyltransferase